MNKQPVSVDTPDHTAAFESGKPPRNSRHAPASHYGARDAKAARQMAIWLACICALVAAIVTVGGATRLTDSGLSITEWDVVMGAFPPVGDLPYMLTLPAYGFYWFLLAPETEAPRWHAPPPDPLPEFVTLTATGGKLSRALEGRELRQLERDVLPEFLSRQRWFAGKSDSVKEVHVANIGSIPGENPNELLALDVETTGGASGRYLLPVSALWGEFNLTFGAPKLSYTLARVRTGPNLGALIDAAFDERFYVDLVNAMRAGEPVPAPGGRLTFEASDEFKAIELSDQIRPVGVEQSNVSFIFGSEAMVKVYRRVRAGEQPEIEIARFLTEVAGFRNTPAFLGSATYEPEDGEAATLAAAFVFVRNQGDAWGVLLEALERDLEAFALLHRDEEGELLEPANGFDHPLDFGATIGRRTAELHVGFATPTSDRRFKAEPIGAADLKQWTSAIQRDLTRSFGQLSRSLKGLNETARAGAETLIKARAAIERRVAAATDLTDVGQKTRAHGDYHLGQLLVAQDDVVIVDFEGEPGRGMRERRQKTSPLRDVAGMLRSFDYAAWSAIIRHEDRAGAIVPGIRERALAWRDAMSDDFLSTYWPIAGAAGILPGEAEARGRLLDLFLIEKAVYEIAYEVANRPAWLPIPVSGLLALVNGDGNVP